MTPEAPPPEPPPLVITADRIVLEPGVFTASGGVRATREGLELTADRARLVEGEGALVVEGGALPAEGLTFASGTIALDGSEGALTDFTFDQPGLHARGARAAWAAPGTIRLEEGGLTPCDCEPPLWSIEARRATIDLDGYTTLTRGWVLLGGRRFFPVPVFALPSPGRRVHPLPPRLGWTDDGLLLGLPIWIPLGRRAEIALGPEWRGRRGIRGLGELGARGDAGHVDLSGALGYDRFDEAWRGDLDFDAAGGWGEGWRVSRLATRGAIVSDAEVLADFGDDLVSRSAPWIERRYLAGFGPLRAERFDWTGDGEALEPGALGALVVERPAWAVGPVRLGAGGRIERPMETNRFEVSGEVDHTSHLGPVEWDAGLDGRVFTYEDTSAADGVAHSALWLPAWREGERWRQEIAVGAEGSLGRRAGGVLVRSPRDLEPAPWTAGPTLEARAWRQGGAWVGLTAGLPWAEIGPSSLGRLRVGAGPWSASLQSAQALAEEGEGLHGGRAGYRDERLDAWTSARWRLGDAPVTVYRAGLGVTVGGAEGRSAWTPQGRAMATPEGVQEWGSALKWRAGCGCLAVRGSADFAVDRALPTLGLQLDVFE